MNQPSYPKLIQLPYQAAPRTMAELLVFVEEGGVRLDNSGPLPPRQARRLRDWLTRYLKAARRTI